MVAQHYPNAFISEGEEVPNAPSWLQSIADANKLNKSIESKGDRDMLNSLVLRLGHADSSVRHLAAKCLSNVAVKGDERVLGALLNLGGGAVRRGAEDHDHDVRVASIESAGAIVASFISFVRVVALGVCLFLRAEHEF